MATFDEEEFEKLTLLSRIHCTKNEKKELKEKLADILRYVEMLKEIDTEGVTPCNHILESVSNVMREDTLGETLDREDFLENSPSHVGGMIRTPPVIKFDEE